MTRTEAIKLRIPRPMYSALKQAAWDKGVSAAALARWFIGDGLRIPESERNPRPYQRKRPRRKVGA